MQRRTDFFDKLEVRRFNGFIGGVARHRGIDPISRFADMGIQLRSIQKQAFEIGGIVDGSFSKGEVQRFEGRPRSAIQRQRDKRRINVHVVSCCLVRV